MNEITNEKHMTIKEVASILKLTERSIQSKVKSLFPEKVFNGKKTYLNEKEVTIVKLDLEKKFEVETELEQEMFVEKALLIQRNKILKLEKENEAMKPKAGYFDALVDNGHLTNFRDTAKQLKIGQKEFISMLINDGFVYRDQKKKIRPNAEYTEYFELKDFLNNGYNDKQTFITVQGKNYFRTIYEDK